MDTEDSRDLLGHMLDRYGPTLGGQDLYAALGFKTYAAFYRSQKRGELGVNVFSLPGRRGWFALTKDVAVWLKNQKDRNVSDANQGGLL